MKQYSKGEPIKSLDELVSQEFIYYNHKITHRGWFLSWQLKMTLDAIQKGRVFKAIKNKEEKDNGKTKNRGAKDRNTAFSS